MSLIKLTATFVLNSAKYCKRDTVFRQCTLNITKVAVSGFKAKPWGPSEQVKVHGISTMHTLIKVIDYGNFFYGNANTSTCNFPVTFTSENHFGKFDQNCT